MKIAHVYNVYLIKMEKGDRSEMFTWGNYCLCNHSFALTVSLRDITQFKHLLLSANRQT